LNKGWCKLSMKWTKIIRPQLVLVRLKGGAFWTFYYNIQYNYLEDHQLSKKSHQLKILIFFWYYTFKNFRQPCLLETFFNYSFKIRFLITSSKYFQAYFSRNFLKTSKHIFHGNIWKLSKIFLKDLCINF
jgi:hypothetical protein